MIQDVRGPAFPFRIDPATGSVAWASGAEKIRQNVWLVLGTRLGERPMLRDFGARVHALLQEPLDAAFADLLASHAREALLQWERRILVAEATVEREEEGAVRLRLSYVHTEEQAGGEIVVPLR